MVTRVVDHYGPEETARLVGVSRTTLGRWQQGRPLRHMHWQRLEAIDPAADALLSQKALPQVGVPAALAGTFE
jgi:hypothetical protein